MAIQKVCAVHDAKASTFNQPLSFPSLGFGIRDFSDAFSCEDNKMAKHRDDFALYHIADYETDSGLLTPIVPPVLVFKGSDIGGE